MRAGGGLSPFESCGPKRPASAPQQSWPSRYAASRKFAYLHRKWPHDAEICSGLLQLSKAQGRINDQQLLPNSLNELEYGFIWSDSELFSGFEQLAVSRRRVHSRRHGPSFADGVGSARIVSPEEGSFLCCCGYFRTPHDQGNGGT